MILQNEVRAVKSSDISTRANFNRIRYSQCWEDADVLLAALNIQPGQTCLSVASAGDNTLAIVASGASRVIAVDLSEPQIACLELRSSAYRNLSYDGLLELLGQSDSKRRSALYQRCRADLSAASRNFWDSNPGLIHSGIATVGKFERYLALFRQFILPLIHGRKRVRQLFLLESVDERADFFYAHWRNKRWETLSRLVFGQLALGRLGRDPSFYQYADEPVWSNLQRRIPHALIEQRPAENPYLQWILFGQFQSALPYALREENFDAIRRNLDALEMHCGSIEEVVAALPDRSLDACNLSDIFEYVSEPAYADSLSELARAGNAGCRLAYWNLVTERRRPEYMSDSLRECRELSATLHRSDKAFFYRDLVIEEVI